MATKNVPVADQARRRTNASPSFRPCTKDHRRYLLPPRCHSSSITLFCSTNYTDIAFATYLCSIELCMRRKSAIGHSHEQLVYCLHTIVDRQILRRLRPFDSAVDQFCHRRDHVVHRSNKLHRRVTFPTKTCESASRHQHRSTCEVDEMTSSVPRARYRRTPSPASHALRAIQRKCGDLPQRHRPVLHG